VEKAVICQLDLDEAKVKHFKDAIENNYWFEFFVGMFFIESVDILLIQCDDSFGIPDQL
jgi:hypothetical protein